MKLIDSHFHLNLLAADWLPCNGLFGGLAVTTGTADWQTTRYRLAGLSGFWRYALGVHPWFADMSVDWMLFESLLGQDAQCAIGEVGLDGSQGRPIWSVQQSIFVRQLSYSREYQRLLSLHLVNDGERGYQLIRAMQGLPGGIVHAFNGSLVQAQRWQGLGFHIGIGPRLLNRLSAKHLHMLRALDLSQIHLETDAPNDNAPYYVYSPNDLGPYLKQLSQVLECSADSLSNQLYDNWCRLWSFNGE